jgi:hypothetical protein
MAWSFLRGNPYHKLVSSDPSFFYNPSPPVVSPTFSHKPQGSEHLPSPDSIDISNSVDTTRFATHPIAEEEKGADMEKKAILFVSTHGEIVCSENDGKAEINYITIPEGMKITKVTMGFQGNVNRVGDGAYDFALKLIDDIFKDKLLSHDDRVVDETIDEIIGHLKEIAKHGVNNDINVINKKKRKNEEEKYTVFDYVHGMNNFVEKFVLVGGDRIANKIYFRGKQDELDKLGDLDYTITILNSSNKIDVLSDMKRRTRYGIQKITTEEVLNYFHSRGIDNLIIFDYSCSVYGVNTKSNKKTRILRDRELRSLRNRHRDDAYGGKRNINKSKKTTMKRTTMKRRKTRGTKLMKRRKTRGTNTIKTRIKNKK